MISTAINYTKKLGQVLGKDPDVTHRMLPEELKLQACVS